MGDGANKLPRPSLGLSVRLLVLTVFFVMLAELFIYTPSIANFRINYLAERIVRAHLATLALEAMEEGEAEADLEKILLKQTGMLGIAINTKDRRLLITSGDSPPAIDAQYDFRDNTFFGLIADAFMTLAQTENRVLRVIGTPPQARGQRIEIIINETPLRHEMYAFSQRIFNLSIVISLFTATLVYASLQLLMVRPMRRITASMAAFREAPEDETRRLLSSSERSDEIGIAQRELMVMQEEVRDALRQQSRLAMLGAAVSKINHDVRNCLATAMLVGDKLSMSSDPEVKSSVPALNNAIDKALNLCGRTLEYVSGSTPDLELAPTDLAQFIDEVGDTLSSELADKTPFNWASSVSAAYVINADHEQLLRVVTNLGRNAVQAGAKMVKVNVHAADEPGRIVIDVIDDGPGMAEKAKKNLFKPFAGSARVGGTGLGLVIAREIIEAHGGTLDLVKTGEDGTTFRIVLPELARQPAAA